MSIIAFTLANNVSLLVGRNGGHLTSSVFLDFRKRQQTYGTEQALRSFALENYTTSEILKIIKHEGLEGKVDFVSGGHVAMLVTEREVADAQADYEAARHSGADLTEVEWLGEGEMNKVGALTCI